MAKLPLPLGELTAENANEFILDRLDAIDELTIEQRRAALNQVDAQRAVDIETEVARIRAAMLFL